MDISIAIGVIGILVSIVIGFGTFYLSDKSTRRNRWQSAKDTILRDLSKSLGEGNVPELSIILATTRSVLRSNNASDLSSVTVEEIADDLLRQITSDPFLDAERRKKLQNDLIVLKTQAEEEAKAPRPQETERSAIQTIQDALFSESSISSFIIGLIASLIAGIIFFWIDRGIPMIEAISPNKMIEYGPTILIVFIYATIVILYSTKTIETLRSIIKRH